MKESPLEEMLLAQITSAKLPVPIRQSNQPWQGTGRRFLADFCWPDYALVVEVDGGTWVKGRHATGAGFERDCVKLNLAVIAGWRVLRVTGAQVKRHEALSWIRRVLESTDPGA